MNPMENDPEIQVTRLLRLKRYELPPEGYTERFLSDFHRHQRVASMRQSRLESTWDFLLGLWPNFEVPKMAYAMVAALALLVGAGMFAIPSGSNGPQVAVNEPYAPLSDFPLIPARPVTIQSTIPAASVEGGPSHYVLQPSPANNDLPLSF